LRGYKPNNVFIYGTVGTGKTITTRFVLSELMQTSAMNENRIKVVYVNCKMKRVADTEYRLIAQLLKDLGVYVPDTGISTSLLYRRFFEEIEVAKESIIIIVLDEIDALFKKIGDEFLYNLTRINSELEKSKIAIIGITNDLSFYDRLDVRVKSSLGEEEIVFKPYNAVQLRDILLARCGLGFNSMPEEGVINKISAIAAQEHGDARRALDLLRVSAEIAERYNSQTIEEKHVDIAREKLEMDKTVETVRSQPKHSRTVLHSIIRMSEENKKKNGWADRRLLTGDVYETYKQSSHSQGLRPLTQRRVSDLIGELDMLGLINARVISKGRHGRTRQISLAVTDSVLSKINILLKEQFD
jgi:cell division control protein 6